MHSCVSTVYKNTQSTKIKLYDLFSSSSNYCGNCWHIIVGLLVSVGFAPSSGKKLYYYSQSMEKFSAGHEGGCAGIMVQG